MIKTLGFLYRLVKLYGLKHGIPLFINFQTEKIDRLNVPGIQTKVSLRSGTSDRATFFQVFLNKEYDIPFTNAPEIIIDGGANIGLFTVLMKNKFPDSKIISIEPDKENFEMLKRNTAGYKNVYYENCGLWNRATNLKVYDKYDMGKWGMVVEENDEEGNISAITLGDLVTRYSISKIDILKLDIETSEKKVFLDNYESWLPLTKMIIIELHDWMEEDCSKPFFTAINKTFSRYKYSIKGENTIISNNS